MPVSHVRALSSDLSHVVRRSDSLTVVSAASLLNASVTLITFYSAPQFENTKGTGMWSRWKRDDSVLYRLVNQTTKCTGPRLVVFSKPVTEVY